jgi:hypothetical protein
MRVLLAALALACGLHAAQAQSCIPAEIALAMIRAQPNYVSHHVAKDREIALAAEIFNAAPPATEQSWSTAVLVTLASGGAIYVGRDGVLCGRLMIEERSWPAVRRRIVGAKA